ncbi:hypothetical protein BG621_07360 [Parasaccharibacter apium]|nr:hypothetical protein BG621_07360 [Parasaccharibacter apium]
MNAVDYSYAHVGGLNPFVSLLIFAVLMLALFGLYFLPSVIALIRRHPQRWILVGLNVLSGWTGLGWIGLLLWSLWPREELLAVNRRLASSGQDWGPYQNREQSFGGQSAADELAKLAQLKERGVLSEAEFEQAKERLLHK